MAMNLEPEVIDRIAAEKRRVLVQKTTVVACLIPGLLLFLGLIVPVVFNRQINIDPDKIATLKWLAMGALGFALFCTIIQYLQIMVTFNNLLRKQQPLPETTILDAPARNSLPENNTQLSPQRFINGIEGASIAVGFETPPLVVLNIPKMSSLSFKSYDKLSIVGVTQSALDAGLSDQEAEALMAHEISHIIIGDILKPPNFFSFSTLFIALPILLIPAFGLIGPALGGNQYAGALFILFLSNIIWYPLAYYLFRKRYKLLDRHEDILADSIACKITSNPQALLTVIEKLTEENLLGRMPIAQGMLTLVASTSEYYHQDSILLRTDSPPLIDRGRIPIVVSAWNEKDAIEERKRNLFEIQKGHWQAFETVGHGRVKQEADLWE